VTGFPFKMKGMSIQYKMSQIQILGTAYLQSKAARRRPA
jgi:hypothetical protein